MGPVHMRTRGVTTLGPFLAVLVLCALLLAATPAPAAPSKVDTLKAQLETIRGDLADAGAAYDRAYWELDETEARIEKLDAQAQATEEELSQKRSALSARFARLYRTDAVDVINVLIGASSFEEFVTTLDYFQRIGRADADAIAEAKALRRRLAAERAEAERERENRSAALSQLAKERDALKGRLSAKQSEYEKVKEELAAARKRETGSTTVRVSGVPGANGMVFPVQGVNYYSDTWGASRDGGRRRHQGTDIMAARGTPCVAVLSGTVRRSSSSKGGNSIWLSADNGWVFFYAHLDGYAGSGGRVSAGEVIGYVGSTGNASASAPHLHFEIHPGGGSAVNPYPYLRAME